MKRLVDQIADKCIHYTGSMNETCDKGIRYVDVTVKGPKPPQMPCFKSGVLSGGSCQECQFPTQEEAILEAEQIGASALKTIKAFVAVKKHAKANNADQGKIPHEICGGEISYAIAPNGHARFVCTKCGLSGME